MKFGNRRIKDVKIVSGQTGNSMKLKELLISIGENDFKSSCKRNKKG